MKFANLRNLIKRICESSQIKKNLRNEETMKERRGESKKLGVEIRKNYFAREMPKTFIREVRVEEFMPNSLAAPFSPDTFQPLCSRANRMF